MEFPVLWVQGENASLTLGKPGMEHELIIDGGYLNTPPIEAHCPLIAVSGPDSKLIMYDKVTLQNNYNSGVPPDTGYYQYSGGVFIRTEGDFVERQAEFIMRGGVIRGNVNSVHGGTGNGGAVSIRGFGLFTMEGGIIMDNTATGSGGGFNTGGRGSFKKTGGIIYGKNAPKGFRNTSINGFGNPKAFGRAVCVWSNDSGSRFRNDTVGENDNLSFIGVPTIDDLHLGGIGQGEKWNSLQKQFRQRLVVAIILLLIIGVPLFFIIRTARITAAQKRLAIAIASNQTSSGLPAVESIIELTPKEKEVLPLLFTNFPLKQIAGDLNTNYSNVYYHSQNIYKKLGIKTRMELITKFKKGE